jgi:hypothetical protein
VGHSDLLVAGPRYYNPVARVHLAEKQPQEARRAFDLARTAFQNARTEPPLC